jgi:hypothetical protein
MRQHKPHKEFSVSYRKHGERRWTTTKFYSNSAHPGMYETAEEVLEAFATEIPGAEIKVTDLGWR